MILPEDHEREEERIKALESYAILDTLPEKEYEDLTKLAAEVCNTPISLVTLLDAKRQWFKSHHGLQATETPKKYAFCAHAINDDSEVFVVEDSRTDLRFVDNPLVDDPRVIFYAGVPLKGSDGLPLGTLCVIDHETRSLSKNQLEALKILADQVMNLLELRKSKMQLEAANKELERHNIELERFAFIAAHDLKSPLNNIHTLAGFLKEEIVGHLTEKGETIIKHIQNSTAVLKKFIDGLLDYSGTISVLTEKKARIALETLRNNFSDLFASEDNCSIELHSDLKFIKANGVAVEQILLNLIANAIKYNDKEAIVIKLIVEDDGSHYKITVSDNGPGIGEEDRERIFELFQTLDKKDKSGQYGTGIGLATVKRMVEGLGGSIFVTSAMGEGTKFVFTLKK